MTQSRWVREIFKKQNCRTCCLDLGRVRERSERQTSKFLARIDGEVLLAESWVQNSGKDFSFDILSSKYVGRILRKQCLASG